MSEFNVDYGELLRQLAGHGRYGDTELAHVNPEEKALLKARGGSGSINPYTGLREYFDVLSGGASTDTSTGGPSAGPAASESDRLSSLNFSLADPSTTPGTASAPGIGSKAAGIAADTLLGLFGSALGPFGGLALNLANKAGGTDGLGYLGSQVSSAFAGGTPATTMELVPNVLGTSDLVSASSSAPGKAGTDRLSTSSPIESISINGQGIGAGRAGGGQSSGLDQPSYSSSTIAAQPLATGTAAVPSSTIAGGAGSAANQLAGLASSPSTQGLTPAMFDYLRRSGLIA